MQTSSIPLANTYWFIFQHDQLLFIAHNHLNTMLTEHELAYIKPYLISQHALGTFNHISCYCAELILPETFKLPSQYHFMSLRKALEMLGPDWYQAVAKAYSIINWDKNHQFCGRCGHATMISVAGLFERKCNQCGLILYPRISPSIIVLIHKQDSILMARSPHFAPGAYGLIAGFVEAGETVEETVHREVQEEVGIKIKNLSYFGSQSWPFPDSLMLGFIAAYASGEINIDQREIETANWYHFRHLPGRPTTSISIANRLIDHFISLQKDKE